MTAETKDLLLRSIANFENQSPEDKKHSLEFVRKQVQKHYDNENVIGLGFANHYVSAGEIFLRIYKNKPL